MEESVLQDLEFAEKLLTENESSIVVVKNGEVLAQKQGEGIKPSLETIDELGKQMQGSIVADKILGKASAMLYAYVKVSAVFSPRSTKTALAVLIRAGIPGQTDEMVPFVKEGMCEFERLLVTIDSPEEAYKVLKQSLE